ncbi:site-specific integrase [Bacteroides sp. OttesenSCG-928-D19]|nr:site-specific integrase [Bacteroides sp. OttesenSCG-928-N06]MDL2304830.1 site-specific integrase [Bacteroides sp. OttesenSCG-928-D19]
MTVAKFRVVIRREKRAKSTNEAPVCLRITKDRRTTYKTLLHVDPQYWDDDAQCVKKQHPNAELLNATIAKKRASLEQETLLLTLTNDSVGISTIRNKINGRTSFDLFEYANKYIEQLHKDGKHATYKKNKSVIKKLRFYVGKDSLPIKTITLDFIKQYERFLLNNIGNNRNTTTVNMKALAKLVGDIYRNYDLDEVNNPFRKIKFKREQTDRAYLEIEDIKKILNLRFKRHSPLYDAREIFLFECFTGIRISDILTLKWKSVTDKEITIFMRKTDKPFSIPQQDVVKSILNKRRLSLENNGGQIFPEKYVFNILKVDIEKVPAQDALNAISSATAIINKQLKKIAEKAGITKNLSTHVARHSFATMLVTRDVGISVIRDLLGHGDIRVTQIYAKVISKKKEEAINVLNNL